MTDYPKLKDHPRLKRLISRVSPGYRKLTVNLQSAATVACHGSYWDGGSRTFYAQATKSGHNVKTVNTSSAPPQFGGSTEPVTVELDTDTVVVTGGTFRGKPAHATIYASPDAIEWLLSEETS